MQITPAIFKAYDIRGLYPSELNEEIARQIGRGYAAYREIEIAWSRVRFPPPGPPIAIVLVGLNFNAVAQDVAKMDREWYGRETEHCEPW